MSCDEITQILQSHVKDLGIFLSGLGNEWRFLPFFWLHWVFNAGCSLSSLWHLASKFSDQGSDLSPQNWKEDS